VAVSKSLHIYQIYKKYNGFNIYSFTFIHRGRIYNMNLVFSRHSAVVALENACYPLGCATCHASRHSCYTVYVKWVARYTR